MRALGCPAFRAGYDAWKAWENGPPWQVVNCSPHRLPADIAADMARAASLENAPWPEPANPFPAGSPSAARWALGAEQADLEGGSAESWRDGGAGMDRGVLREVWEAEQAARGSS